MERYCQNTLDYYNSHADSFREDTIHASMSALQQAITKGMAWQPMLIWDAVIALACAAVMYAATAFLMDRHLSV